MPIPVTRSAAGQEQIPAQPAVKEVAEAAEAAVASVPPGDDGEKDLDYFMERMRSRVNAYHDGRSVAETKGPGEITREDIQIDRIKEAGSYRKEAESLPVKSEQISFLTDEQFLRDGPPSYTLIGQVFDTYWLVQFNEQLYIIDQHAAHERVLYEKTLAGMKSREYTAQYITPPIVLDLSMQEAAVLTEYMDQFTRIGFEIESFGGDSYVIRAIPDNLFGIAKKELFIEMLDGLTEGIHSVKEPDIIDEKIASMSCKAAVKGNSALTASEVDTLIGDLLTLENPYHCPHGRPTIISMSKRELEKKFKRIV